MRIIHWDKKRKFPTEAILPDWRKWAKQHEYLLDSTVPLTYGKMSILFEIYKHPDTHSKETYLLYHPPIGTAANTEILCILPDNIMLQQILEAEKQMALSVMKLLQQDENA
jgi:hypothetical protein